MRKAQFAMALAAIACLGSSTALPATISGTLYYTLFSGEPNVWSVTYSYDTTAHTLSMGTKTSIASIPGGADGILFANNGDLVVAGDGDSHVFMLTPSGSPVANVASGSSTDYHLTLDPSGNFLYTSPFGGPLDVVPMNPFAAGTASAVHGNDPGVTQLAFAPNGNVFYTDSNPNCCGNVGLINISNLNNIQTTRLETGLVPAHGIVYDSFTNLMTLFGGGAVATMDTTGANLKQRVGITCDFDQGAVDGQGHALIAGCGDVTFIDYSVSHDITNPSNPTIVETGFGAIDDLAPLSGAGSLPPPPTGQVPEPGSVLLLSSGVLLFWRRRNRPRLP